MQVCDKRRRFWNTSAGLGVLFGISLAVAGCFDQDDPDAQTGERTSAVAAEIPGLPVLIALGDSVTSGHHGGGATLVCDDPSYGYPARVFANLEASAGEDWYRSEQYVNLAHSGFGTEEVLQGGTNYCGATFSAPITDAVSLLEQHVNSVVPNQVVISVGINNTNWTQVMTGVATIHALNQMPGMTAAQCENVIQNGYSNGFNVFPGWNGPAVSFIDGDTGIVQGVIHILNQLVQADPRVQISFIGYYNMANTGFSVTDNSGPYTPAVCNAAVASRQQELNIDWIRDYAIRVSQAAANTTFVSTAALNGQNNKLQQLTGRRGLGISTTGWPHPNPDGHNAIGDAVVPPP